MQDSEYFFAVPQKTHKRIIRIVFAVIAVLVVGVVGYVVWRRVSRPAQATKPAPYVKTQAEAAQEVATVYAALEKYASTKDVFLSAEQTNALSADENLRAQQKLSYMQNKVAAIKPKRPGIVVTALIDADPADQTTYNAALQTARGYFKDVVSPLLSKPDTTVDQVRDTMSAAAKDYRFTMPLSGYAYALDDISMFEQIAFTQEPGSLGEAVNNLKGAGSVTPVLDFSYRNIGIVKQTEDSTNPSLDSWTELLNKYK